jgi:hypothetical protein
VWPVDERGDIIESFAARKPKWQKVSQRVKGTMLPMVLECCQRRADCLIRPHSEPQ